ncbi:MAG: hypothetical protein DRH90_20460 [Deltaproteobacteria bacterium]|nr:MAG: hypothetical protein DRH90_20460 [Deltaproteobacteria bacterium]
MTTPVCIDEYEGDQSFVDEFKIFPVYYEVQLSVFTIDRAKWVIRWRFALFKPIRAPNISA